ncbi:1-pyrroline-5-carboxylate dehydrogenase [Paraburkholderia unamae]|uniref:Uncharacterized protein n=1 Tax=Paraburkholderia unamae TaxID=219649 RepID=A0ABX5KCN2_9BURK|nr:1-pyrroline-5-carboxylate dehydrogenase [Paraburkholderia unamae]PVX61282.1 hypothetical protein C7402_14275 [Paraburkholderia unamae]
MRDDITKYLGTVQQSTAKTIASRIGMDQLEVARELNHMLADGLVEREKKHGAGNEYYYWLSRADRAPEASDQTTEAATMVEASSAAPATDAIERQVIALRNQIVDLNARLEAGGSLRVQIETERDELKIENDAMKQANTKLRENNAALEARIDELTLGPVGAKSPLFVTVGRYSKPMRHDSLEKAQKRAAALVRGEKESRVLVLEPVGSVIRGSEWLPRKTA